jgi:uncharacterized protein with HEPN domain
LRKFSSIPWHPVISLSGALIHDLDKWEAETALTVIDNQVSRLIEELRKNPVLGPGLKAD